MAAISRWGGTTHFLPLLAGPAAPLTVSSPLHPLPCRHGHVANAATCFPRPLASTTDRGIRPPPCAAAQHAIPLPQSLSLASSSVFPHGRPRARGHAVSSAVANGRISSSDRALPPLRRRPLRHVEGIELGRPSTPTVAADPRHNRAHLTVKSVNDRPPRALPPRPPSPL